MDVYVVIFMFMLLFCIIAVCALLFRREKAAAAAKKKENKTHENNKRNISRAFAIFFISCRPTNANVEKYMCVYCLLAVYCFFHFGFAGAMFFLVRERESARHVSLIFRLKMYGSIVLGALGCFNGLKINIYFSDRVED